MVEILTETAAGRGRLVNFDKLTYAGNLDSLAAVLDHHDHVFLQGDVAEREAVDAALAEYRPAAIVHFAAESHVDRSILGAADFVMTNVVGTQSLLDAALRHGIDAFVHVSTDEVYGSLGPTGLFTEETPLAPSSPYSASKASSDLLALAYARTYGLPAIVTRCSNNYGAYQLPEKLVPLMIANALRDEPLPVYGDGLNVRDWIHVDDHARGLLAALDRGAPGEVYNFGGESERRNLDIVRRVLALLGKPESLIRFVADRPGHDRRYAMDARKAMARLGWAPRRSFEEGLAVDRPGGAPREPVHDVSVGVAGAAIGAWGGGGEMRAFSCSTVAVRA